MLPFEVFDSSISNVRICKIERQGLPMQLFLTAAINEASCRVAIASIQECGGDLAYI